MIVTDEAVVKLKEVLVENGENEGSLRVIAVPGEAGGIQYMMSMERESQQGDTVMTLDGLSFLVDEDSAPFLEEATIDYMEDFPRAGFVISNPNFASGGCGCGAGGCGCGNGGCGCGSGGCGNEH
jgi:iron-sulfur cluster assembly accessory protein